MTKWTFGKEVKRARLMQAEKEDEIGDEVGRGAICRNTSLPSSRTPSLFNCTSFQRFFNNYVTDNSLTSASFPFPGF
jgi:hypothetical protein